MMAECFVEGCHRPHRARGLCAKHYQYAAAHDALPPRAHKSSWEMWRFLAHAIRATSDGCYVWPYVKSSAGYGMLSAEKSSRFVHRFVCEVVHGPAPSQKHEVAHNCGVRACINPQHLRWDTRKGNAADKIIHGTAQRGEQGTGAKLTNAQVQQIRAQSHKTDTALAAEFGVHRSNVGLIRTRKTWRHI